MQIHQNEQREINIILFNELFGWSIWSLDKNIERLLKCNFEWYILMYLMKLKSLTNHNTY
jgi:hypothetical protein